MATELHYPERFVFMIRVLTQFLWTFKLGVEDINIPIRIYVVFHQSDREHDQNFNNDTFYRMPVTSYQCITGTEKNPESAILLN